MAGPPLARGQLRRADAATALYCASRLVLARTHRRRTERDVDLVHVVMGVAMAGLLVSWLAPPRAASGRSSWGGGWFGWPAWYAARPPVLPDVTGTATRRSHHVPHLMMSGTMVYMLLAPAR